MEEHMKIVLVVLCLFIAAGCSNKVNIDDPSTLMKPMGDEFIYEKENDERNFKVIYEYNDGRKIISEFDSIKYKNNDRNTDRYLLEDAIENNIVTIDYIISKQMFLADISNDNFKIYGNTDNNPTVFFIICDTPENNNIIIGTSQDVASMCEN